jgi:hypothetical protein
MYRISQQRDLIKKKVARVSVVFQTKVHNAGAYYCMFDTLYHPLTFEKDGREDAFVASFSVVIISILPGVVFRFPGALTNRPSLFVC